MNSITSPAQTDFQSSLPTRRSVRQTLLIDAGDTLWENNIYFERAITSFISYLMDHRVHTSEEVRERLNACERATIAKHGYGLKSFRRSLVDCFEQLSDGPITPEKHTRALFRLRRTIAAHEIELLNGVEETLRELGGRHRLILVTKGNPEEQNDKVERSGLRELFAAVEVPHEKTAAMYRELTERHDCDVASIMDDWHQFTAFGHQSGAGCGSWGNLQFPTTSRGCWSTRWLRRRKIRIGCWSPGGFQDLLQYF